MKKSRPMTRSDFRHFMRHLAKTMRYEKIHRGMRRSIDRAIRSYFYK